MCRCSMCERHRNPRMLLLQHPSPQRASANSLGYRVQGDHSNRHQNTRHADAYCLVREETRKRTGNETSTKHLPALNFNPILCAQDPRMARRNVMDTTCTRTSCRIEACKPDTCDRRALTKHVQCKQLHVLNMQPSREVDKWTTIPSSQPEAKLQRCQCVDRKRDVTLQPHQSGEL